MNRNEQAPAKLTFFDHLTELRGRLISILLTAALGTTAFYFVVPLFVNHLNGYISTFHLELAFFSVTEAFTLKIKLAFFGGIVLSSPFIIYQAASFIGPGLTKEEKDKIRSFLVWLSIFFTIGVIFGAVLIMPYLISYLIKTGQSFLSPIISGDRFYSFILSFSLLMGIIFLIPPVITGLAKLGLFTYNRLRKARKYFWIGFLTITSLIAPATDFISFLLIGSPAIILYEASVLMVFLSEKRRLKRKK